MLYNSSPLKISTWNLVGNEDIILGPVPFRAELRRGDYRAEIILRNKCLKPHVGTPTLGSDTGKMSPLDWVETSRTNRKAVRSQFMSTMHKSLPPKTGQRMQMEATLELTQAFSLMAGVGPSLNQRHPLRIYLLHDTALP